ncbi:hypothetical protein [Marinobacter changyiensis]|uniref:hypothetical protein n=1 Tax=Marinobacter changyiensis TaxID=2604091 RepID=UPI001263FE20|nr:hypothetical protein [Marinobacter changyiensis]
MNKTINGKYDSDEQARNTEEDLIATGIPRDNVYRDKPNQVIKVSVPAETEREIQEIFTRHGIHFDR